MVMFAGPHNNLNGCAGTLEDAFFENLTLESRDSDLYWLKFYGSIEVLDAAGNTVTDEEGNKFIVSTFVREIDDDERYVEVRLREGEPKVVTGGQLPGNAPWPDEPGTYRVVVHAKALDSWKQPIQTLWWEAPSFEIIDCTASSAVGEELPNASSFLTIIVIALAAVYASLLCSRSQDHS